MKIEFSSQRRENVFVLDHQHGRRDVTCKGNGVQALAQRFLGLFEWTRVTSDWFIVALNNIN